MGSRPVEQTGEPVSYCQDNQSSREPLSDTEEEVGVLERVFRVEEVGPSSPYHQERRRTSWVGTCQVISTGIGLHFPKGDLGAKRGPIGLLSSFTIYAIRGLNQFWFRFRVFYSIPVNFSYSSTPLLLSSDDRERTGPSLVSTTLGRDPYLCRSDPLVPYTN